MLNKITGIEKHIVGGKAYNLSRIRLISDDFLIANGFSVTTDLFDRYNSLRKHFLKKNNAPGSELYTIRKEMKSTKFLINDRRLLFTFSGKLRFPLIARSSATVEDSKEYSFAGIFKSFPNITNKQKLIEGIKGCWASLYNARVVAYCNFHRISINDVKMAVLIQEQVDAEKSGVIFTKDPRNAQDNNVIIEAVKGFGDKLVSGRINPSKYAIGKNNLILRNYGEEGRMQKVLTQKEIVLLARCAVKIEDFFRFPQDIEWSIRKNKVYIHQSRDLKIAELDAGGAK